MVIIICVRSLLMITILSIVIIVMLVVLIPGAMVDGHARCGDVESARWWLRRMEASGICI